MKRTAISFFALLLTIFTASAQILFSDYSDPDVCKAKYGVFCLSPEEMRKGWCELSLK